MLTARLSWRYLWSVVSACLTAGVLLLGCAPKEALQPPQPPPPSAEVSKRLAALEECAARSQRAVTAAADAGVSAGALAPINSSIADAQDALDEAEKLAQQSKQQEAAERTTQGLEECEKIDAMVAKARQDTAERKVRAQLVTEAEVRLGPTATCIDGARQAVRRVSAVGAKSADFATAKGALDSAGAALKQARELLAQNDPKGALGRLDMAQADCQTAQEAGAKAAVQGVTASPAAKPRRSR
jgi:hypothetical protein